MNASRGKPIPVTVLTGFLGSGKTTLLNRILKEHHGQRFAVIENEYGEAGIDAELVVRSGNETIVELANGCVCCTVRGDLAKALVELAGQRARGEISFDWVLIETTGLADPGPIIQTFLAGTELEEQYQLDGVVTLVDAVNIASQIEDCVEVRQQIACADRVLLTKTDLCEAAAIAEAERLIDSMSFEPASSTVARLAVNEVDLATLTETLFGIRGYQTNLVRFTSAFSTAAGTLAAPMQLSTESVAARHTRDVVSFVYRGTQPLDADRFELFIEDAQQRYGKDLWRFKGMLNISGLRHRLVVQGVQGLLQMNQGGSWQPFDKRNSVLVFIGRGLDMEWMLAGLADCERAEA